MRFRFTIRGLFWLILVAALAIGWWIDHNRRDRYQVVEIHGQYLLDMLEGKVWARDGDDWVRARDHEEKPPEGSK